MAMQAIEAKDHEEWLSIRKQVVTATETCAILGLDPWTSVAKMMEEKENPTFEGNGYTWVGQALEPTVVEATNHYLKRSFRLLEAETGKKVIFADFDVGLGATPDAWDDTALLECKTTGTKNWYKWSAWPPLKYLCQLQVQLICTDRRVGYLSILSTDLQQYNQTLNLKLCTFLVVRSNRFEQGLKGELKRFKECNSKDKAFRVDRKNSTQMKLELVKSFKKIL